MKEPYLILEEEVALWADIFPATAITVRSRPHTPAPTYSWDWCLGCPRENKCMLGLTEKECEEILERDKNKAARAATLATLDKLQKWRIKRMNGMLKKDVYIGWNEETNFIESLRRAGEQDGHKTV